MFQKIKRILKVVGYEKVDCDWNSKKLFFQYYYNYLFYLFLTEL